MNRLDLIINALENSELAVTGWVHVHEQKHQAVLAAARELKALEPVAWMWKDGTVTTDPDRADGTWAPLYALDDEVMK